MTSFEESGRVVPQVPGAGSLPRLFSDADGSAVQGAGGGDDGVGEADDGGTGARPLHGGARGGASVGAEGLGGWVDRGHPGARGQAPASRDELAAGRVDPALPRRAGRAPVAAPHRGAGAWPLHVGAAAADPGQLAAQQVAGRRLRAVGGPVVAHSECASRDATRPTWQPWNAEFRTLSRPLRAELAVRSTRISPVTRTPSCRWWRGRRSTWRRAPTPLDRARAPGRRTAGRAAPDAAVPGWRPSPRRRHRAPGP